MRSQAPSDALMCFQGLPGLEARPSARMLCYAMLCYAVLHHEVANVRGPLLCYTLLCERVRTEAASVMRFAM
eukprot:3067569-Pyramimonas_sp.AAC.1